MPGSETKAKATNLKVYSIATADVDPRRRSRRFRSETGSAVSDMSDFLHSSNIGDAGSASATV